MNTLLYLHSCEVPRCMFPIAAIDNDKNCCRDKVCLLKIFSEQIFLSLQMSIGSLVETLQE